ncbi:hypothetical protein OH76DRAFT_1352111 [Lentinus brumalis]|uniref:Uncharacterized protein n=1 Tax=Lentinus brumalis TaxID=2498619 RepID=A0A371D840_9APHY|nr:hypothetical protein OH76DRAFT_1352111 [Polyporus brumalis]
MSDLPFAPSPWNYAVVQMDPVTMVQHLDDSQALEAAERIQPKAYLLHLSWDSGLPFPGKPWYGFSASLVGPGLRAPDEERCIFPDMCIPIFPTIAHPRSRDPIRPKPERPFPYDDCYHWSFTDTRIRVIANPEGFDESTAVKLDAREDTRRERFFAEDAYRQQEALKARDHHRHPPTSREAREATAQEVSTFAGHGSPSDDDYHLRSQPETEDECASIRSGSTHESSTSSLSNDTMTEMGIFGDPSGNIEIQPLVHLWLDLEAHLTQEDIASPVQFFEEIEMITA